MADDRRYIFYRGRSSEDMGLVMTDSTPITPAVPRISSVTIAMRDGAIDQSAQDGHLHYEQRSITYIFTHVVKRKTVSETRKTTIEMNREVTEHIRETNNWFFTDTLTTLVDSAYADTQNNTGYYMRDVRCTEVTPSKVVGPEEWLVNYSVTFTFNPYLYEYGQVPKDFALFSGPTEFNGTRDYVAVEIFADGDNKTLWTNDNMMTVKCTNVRVVSVTEDGDTHDVVRASIVFKPANIKTIYNGTIGFWMNRYFKYTYNNVEYHYYISKIRSVTEGTVNWITSNKLVTPQEYGITTPNGFTLDVEISGTIGSETDLDGLASSIISDTASSGIDDTPLDDSLQTIANLLGDIALDSSSEDAVSGGDPVNDADQGAMNLELQAMITEKFANAYASDAPKVEALSGSIAQAIQDAVTTKHAAFIGAVNGGLIPVWHIQWGTTTTYTADEEQEYTVEGFVPGEQKFRIVLYGETVNRKRVYHLVVKDFNDTFTLDSDAFNELRMNNENYGYYKLESSANLRRSI